jgi:hypothetical protein
MEILKDGKTIYADKTLLEKAMSKYRKIRKRTRRGKTWEKLS